MAEVRILPQAWEDLKQIEDWYRLQFGESSAEKVSNGILNAIERLETFPDSGRSTPDQWLNQLGFRMVLSKHHAAIFRKIQDVVYIYTVVDTRMDYPKVFKESFGLQ